MTEFVDVRFR